MTLPTIVSTKYVGTTKDFLLCKAERDGACRVEPYQASVPTGTAAGAIVGLVPFRKGARMVLNASTVVSDALGTGATGSIGVIYNDNVNFANNATLFAPSAGTYAAGGTAALSFTTTAEQWAALDDGWIVVTTGGTTTATTGNIHGQIVLSYDNY